MHDTQRLHAIAVNQGIAIGPAVVMPAQHARVYQYHVDVSQIGAEVAELHSVRARVEAQFQQELQQARDEAVAGQQAIELLEMHLLLVQDDTLIEGAAQWVRTHRYNAAWALHSELQDILEQYEEVSDDYLRERAQDITQVVTRLLDELQRDKHDVVPATIWNSHPALQAADTMDAPILVAHDLTPSDMLNLQRSSYQAFVTDLGSVTAHTAIMGRSMDIPCLVGAVDATQRVRNGDTLILDAAAGELWLNPSEEVLTEYRWKQREQLLVKAELEQFRQQQVVNAQGQRLHFYANIQLPQDVSAAQELGMDGIGLFRTEYLFMDAEQLPDEEAQYAQYRALLEAMPNKPVTIRTLDIGADKTLAGYGVSAEEEPNPALGLRGLRWCRAHVGIFRTQLRALLRASVHGQLRILIPMLTNMQEAHECRRLLAELEQELSDESSNELGEYELGAMVEVPAAALIADDLLTVFDFLSIGTNDLVQYTLAADRCNQAVVALHDNMHPAVLHLIRHTIAAGQRAGKVVSICGEMAGRAHCATALLEVGLEHYSMNTSQLLRMKAALSTAVQQTQSASV